MKITDNRNKKCVRFGDLKIGDVFIFFNSIYIKTHKRAIDSSTAINCVCLSSGSLTYFNRDDMIEPVNQCELILEN